MSRGGNRPGSGRPSVSEEKKRVQITVSITPETKSKVKLLRTRGMRPGRLLDMVIDDYLAKDK